MVCNVYIWLWSRVGSLPIFIVATCVLCVCWCSFFSTLPFLSLCSLSLPKLHYYWMQSRWVAYWLHTIVAIFLFLSSSSSLIFFHLINSHFIFSVVVVQLFIIWAYRLIIINWCYYWKICTLALICLNGKCSYFTGTGSRNIAISWNL